MTSRERAAALLAELNAADEASDKFLSDDEVVSIMKSAIDDAVAEERDACACLLERMADSRRDRGLMAACSTLTKTAAEVRAQGTK